MFVLSVSAGSAALARSPSASPATLGQRLEVPEAGIAVTFPDDWTVDIRAIVASTDSPEGTTVETRSIQSYGTAPDGGASCLLIEDSLEESLDEAAVYLRSRYEPVLVEMSSIELPLDRAIRFVFDDTDYTDGPMVGAAYLITDGRALFILTCISREPPDDDWWLTIAETFEFLSSESPEPGPTGE